MATAAASFVPVASLLLPPPPPPLEEEETPWGAPPPVRRFTRRFDPLPSPLLRLGSAPTRGSAAAAASRWRAFLRRTIRVLRRRHQALRLSFRTTQESLRNAFEKFGQLVEVNLVMDRVANRPRGFAFLRYATEEESKKAIEGMHGKFLDGRVIFVEVAKPRSELRRSPKQSPRSSSFFIGKDWGT
uniref:RRM domain-containing protein n=1 Tax=Ananas comosus var. bracteatus TaxID=296719 RepID=A0A6V7QNF7_ANACO|nr:unnamed protein product [Ananas comosus var. bracteatus]